MPTYLEQQIAGLEAEGKTPSEIRNELAIMHATNPQFETLMAAVQQRYDIKERKRLAAQPQKAGAPSGPPTKALPVPR